MASLRHTLFCLMALLSLCAPVSAAQQDGVRPLLAGEEQRLLDDQIALLRDPGGLLTIAEVAAPEMQKRFVAQHQGVSQGFTRDIVWLRIPLQREAGAPALWRLEAANAVIDDYRFYGPDGKGGQTLILHAGDRQPFAARPCRYRHPLFPVMLPDDQQRVFYLRLESTSSLFLSLTLWQPDAFRAAVQSELMAIGLAFGVVLSTLLMSIFGGVVIRDRRYLRLYRVEPVLRSVSGDGAGTHRAIRLSARTGGRRCASQHQYMPVPRGGISVHAAGAAHTDILPAA